MFVLLSCSGDSHSSNARDGRTELRYERANFHQVLAPVREIHEPSQNIKE